MKSFTSSLILALLCSATTAVSHTPVADGRLLGTWRLVSTKATFVDGTKGPIPWLGQHGKAYLIYTPDQHMCVVPMNPERPMWNSASTATEREAKSALDGFYAYCGTFDVNDKEALVTHHAEIALAPNDVGGAWDRRFRFEGDRLILQPVEADASFASDSLTWERVR